MSHEVRNMVKKVNALKVRQNLGEVLEKVYYKGDRYVIERAGKPMAAVVPLKVLEDYDANKEELFGLIKKAQRRNTRVKPEVVEREVAEAVRSVRAKRSR